MPNIASLTRANTLYRARMEAKKMNPMLARREDVAEKAFIPLRRLTNLEMGREIPTIAEIAVLSELYGNKYLKRDFCLIDCPYGVYGLDGVKKICAIG